MDNKKINRGQIRAIRGSVVDAFFPQFLPKINYQLKSGEAIIEVTLHLVYNRDRHLFSFKIGELFEMNCSAVSQTAKRFEQKTEVNNEVKENMQKVITALKET